jgi:hypothetical protein
VSALILLLLLALGSLAWVFRVNLVSVAHWSQVAPRHAAYHLVVPTTVQMDPKKLARLPLSLQATTPATASHSANLRPLYETNPELQGKSTQDLTDLLAVKVAALRSQGSDTRNVEAYLKHAKDASDLRKDIAARQFLMDGLQLAVEVQALYAYYH